MKSSGKREIASNRLGQLFRPDAVQRRQILVHHHTLAADDPDQTVNRGDLYCKDTQRPPILFPWFLRSQIVTLDRRRRFEIANCDLKVFTPVYTRSILKCQIGTSSLPGSLPTPGKSGRI